MSCIKTSVPDCVYDYLKNISQSQLDETSDKLFALLKFTSMTKNIKSIHGLKEGIENRITECCKISCNLKDFLSQLQTKRYTLSYLQRTVANVLIDNKYSADDLINEQINYVNILAKQQIKKHIIKDSGKAFFAFFVRVNISKYMLGIKKIDRLLDGALFYD